MSVTTSFHHSHLSARRIDSTIPFLSSVFLEIRNFEKSLLTSPLTSGFLHVAKSCIQLFSISGIKPIACVRICISRFNSVRQSLSS